MSLQEPICELCKNENVLTKVASISPAPGVTLHTFDEVANEFASIPHPPSGYGNVIVDHTGRVFVRTMIAMPGINKHHWGLNEDFIPYNIATIKGMPLTFALQKKTNNAGTEVTFPHPAIPNAPHQINEGFQQAYIIGKYLDYEKKPDHNRVWHGIAEVTNPKAKEFYTDYYKGNKTNLFPTTVSPQVLHYGDENPLDLRRWWFQHVTITDDPAYPAHLAQISAGCVGDESQCLPQLKQGGPVLQNNFPVATPIYQVVDASECPMCVKDALNELTPKIKEDSSLITKSASSSQPMNESNNSGNTTNTAGLDANNTNAGGTNSQQTGAISTAQLQTKEQATVLPEVNKPQGGFSAELEARNLPQQLEEMIKKSVAAYLSQSTQNNPTTEEKKTEVKTSIKKKASEEPGDEGSEEDKKKDENDADKPLTAREKALLDKLNTQEAKISKLAEGERRRGIEMALASVNEGKQFIDPKTKKFDDKKFQEQVNYWVNNTTLDGEGVEKQLKTMIDLVGPIIAPNIAEVPEKTEPTTTRAYAGSSMATIYGVGDVNANSNNEQEVETKKAGSEIMTTLPYFIQLERRTVLRSDPIGQVE